MIEFDLQPNRFQAPTPQLLIGETSKTFHRPSHHDRD